MNAEAESSILAIIGGGMAAQRLVARLLECDFPRKSGKRIAVFSAEPEFGYNRVLLSQLLSGEIERHELLAPPLDAEKGVDLYLADPVTKIDRNEHRVITASGRDMHYWRAVIATGSNTRRVSFKGECSEDIGEFRTLADADELLVDCLDGTPICVVGAGFLGLEVAEGLRIRGADVTVVHRSEWPLNRQLDKQCGERLTSLLTHRGLHFEFGHTVTEINTDHDGRLKGIALDDGQQLSARRLIHAAGIQPNCGLAKRSGLACDQGIQVNDRLMTSDNHVFALGECIEHRGSTFGLVEPIWQQVEVLVSRLCGDDAHFDARPSATRLKISGIDLFAFGDPSPQPGDRWLRYSDSDNGDYRALCVNGGYMRAACLINDTRLGTEWHQLALAHTHIDESDEWLFTYDSAPSPTNIHSDIELEKN